MILFDKYINLIEENYKINILKYEKNEESTDGNVYIIFLKDKKYVVKIYEDIFHTQSVINLHIELIKYINVPNILFTINNETFIKVDNKYIVLYSFLEGIQISKKFKNMPLSTSKKIGKTLRKIHNITQNFNLKEIPFNIDNCTNRKSILHFDLTRSNIFYQKKGEIGFIDFDDAKYGPSICDVSIAISHLYFSKTRGVDLKGLNAFIDSYYGKDLELKKQEIIYIKTYAIAWIDYILKGNFFDTSTIESFEIKKELLNKYM